MTPSIKLHSITFAISTSIVFSIWTQLQKLQELNNVPTIIIGTLISLGIYRIISSTIIYFTHKSGWFKKQFLGNHYVEGTWAGFYIGVSGKQRFYIERFEQGIDTLIIRGTSFNEKSEFHSKWSTETVNMNITTGKISYMYEIESINEKSNNNGIAFLNIDRNNQYSEPNGFTGFTTDLHLGKRVKSKEIKVSNRCDFNEKKAIEIAKKLYKENMGKF
ncbi:hypothetical protein [Olleya namhaensis]|uniref:hypothetical protein n=1 Tax=Olleya namhaensis TaxID=1144750 RepID=UPI0024913489|nr:hypothetical protein [Olleya namhaensis]